LLFLKIYLILLKISTAEKFAIHKSHGDRWSVIAPGFQIIIPNNRTEAFSEEDYLAALNFLKQVYGSEIK